MKVTVVIPNYNGIKFLPDCLNSLKQQSVKDFEDTLTQGRTTHDTVINNDQIILTRHDAAVGDVVNV